jgi:putative ABC transport system permease protein
MLKLAFKFILFDKAKSFGALMGIVISIFLVGQQSGIFLFLTGNMSKICDTAETDIWVVDNRSSDVNSLGRIDTRLGSELQSIKGVARAYPLVIASTTLRVPNGNPGALSLVGTQPPAMIGAPLKYSKGEKKNLLEEGAVCVDEFDKPALSGAGFGSVIELGGQHATVRATTRGYRGFGGLLGCTTIDRARALGKFPTDKVSAFLVHVVKDSSVEAVCSRINRSIYGVHAWSKSDFSKASVKSVLARSGIAMSVGTLVVFAIIAGLFIIGLTLYSAAVDRIRDYGTLKAIGATNGYISRLIYTQAVLFGIIGYALGTLLLQGFQKGISNAGVLFEYPLWLRIAFLVGTMVIAIGGATFAVRRITQVEPASVFR